MTPVEVAIKAFGGLRAMGRATGIDHSVISRWHKPGKGAKRSRGIRRTAASGGKIPAGYFHAILKAAQDKNLNLTMENLVYGTLIPAKNGQPRSSIEVMAESLGC